VLWNHFIDATCIFPTAARCKKAVGICRFSRASARF
jgi:hypothetical protein